MTFLLAKQRTLHVFNDQGKAIQISLREHEGSFAVIEATQAIPVGVYVESCSEEHSEGLQQTGSVEQTGPEVRRVLEISIEFTPDKVLP